MFKIETIHHVSLPVSNIEDSRKFYSGILKLREILRPEALASEFEGAWYEVGDRTLHLIVDDKSTFRKNKDGEGKEISSRDIHFAIRVHSYRETLLFLRSQGFKKGAADKACEMKESPKAKAGFPQIYIMDPDRNVIEFNAEQLDLNETEMKELGLA
jgi:catechol 2,3-dioxygenase-like lactoylglutathione lyase family enzyme